EDAFDFCFGISKRFEFSKRLQLGKSCVSCFLDLEGFSLVMLPNALGLFLQFREFLVKQLLASSNSSFGFLTEANSLRCILSTETFTFLRCHCYLVVSLSLGVLHSRLRLTMYAECF